MDRTSNSAITQALDLSIHFPTGETQNLTFFVTPLDQGCMIVLGFHWLTQFNPSIDWVLGHIFLPIVTAGSQDVTLCRDFVVSTHSGSSEPRSRPRDTSSAGKLETSVSYINQCFCVRSRLQTQGYPTFPTSNLCSRDHWSLRDHFHSGQFEHAS